MHIADEPMQLLGDRALHWPARSRLLLADLHLGKADVFRQAGIALPRGGTAHDLDRVAALLAGTGATSLWVLGDLLHGAIVDSHWRDTWDAWRARHAQVGIVVIAGNHDRALASAGLDVELAGECIDDGPFALRHAPDSASQRHVLCGHLHPVVSVPGVRRRWPAFWLRPAMTILPAFSRFTGGVPIQTGPGERVVACVEGEAIDLSTLSRA